MSLYNPNLLFLRDNLPTTRISALQGGTRSGKTYSALEYLISLADTYNDLIISIVRESFPALRASAIRDFLEIMEDANLYNANNHRLDRSSYEYRHNGNIFEFFSVDNQQKVRGRKRDILFINEANEITLEKFRQLAFRTTGRIILDYNPSDPDSFIYEHVLTRSDCKLFISTYKDNPHLPQEIINEIEILKDADPEYWKIFGLGERGRASGQVLQHYQIIPDSEWPKNIRNRTYGLDFGGTAPTSLVEYGYHDDSHWLKELIYQRNMSNAQLTKRMGELRVSKGITMYCDHEPDRIREVREAGYNTTHAFKDIDAGISRLKQRKLFVHESSVNLIREIKGYRYKKDEASGLYLDEPIGIEDHAIDAGRYGAYGFYRSTLSGGIEQS